MNTRSSNLVGMSLLVLGSLALACSSNVPLEELGGGTERGGAADGGGGNAGGGSGEGGDTASESGGRGGSESTSAAGAKNRGGDSTGSGGRANNGGSAGATALGTGGRGAGGRSSKGGNALEGGVGSGGNKTAPARDGGTGGQKTSTSDGGRASEGGDAGTSSSGGYPLGNAAIPSAGCGKALSTFKSGSANYKMTSAGLNREYIVNIPSNYDSKKAYRLVFGMHCMGSSATQCANSDQFYRLKPLDTGNTTIFVAPQGYTDSAPWRGGDNKDHTLFENLVQLLQSELCIDTSRIFSVGFSFGAMFTNSLAQTHQDTLRGAVVYATADYNIYFPTNSGKPLAYMGVHGTGDGTCPVKSGRASKDRFVKNNGCTAPAKVPEATSSTHVCYDYACPSNYPVKWCTHNGGHTDLPTDPGQSKSWDIDLTWKFITQF